ncbi:MAG: Hint domain-containing protein [Pseudomonadota bacterium]
MTTQDPAPSTPQRAIVYPASVLRAESGAMAGDVIGTDTDVIVGDVYRFRLEQPLELVFEPMMSCVAEGSMVGWPGETVFPHGRHQFLSSRGNVVEALVFSIEGERFVLPLARFLETEAYTVIDASEIIDEMSAFAQVSFPRSTRITRADGQRVKIETLEVGDMVRTRDHGAQPVRWVGRQTIRAEGLTTPVMVESDTLNNVSDLVLSPEHRVYLPKHRDRGSNELVEQLVPVQHLVNGDTIRWAGTRRMAYVHLLFDRHEIVYAEGLPVESLLITPLTLSGLLDDESAAYTSLMDRSAEAKVTQISSLGMDGERIAALLRQSAERQASFRRKSNVSTLLRQRHLSRPNPSRPSTPPSSRRGHGT